MLYANIIGAFIRWGLRGFRTRFPDEVICSNGWFKKIPLIEPFENIIIAQIFVGIILTIILIIIF